MSACLICVHKVYQYFELLDFPVQVVINFSKRLIGCDELIRLCSLTAEIVFCLFCISWKRISWEICHIITGTRTRNVSELNTLVTKYFNHN